MKINQLPASSVEDDVPSKLLLGVLRAETEQQGSIHPHPGTANMFKASFLWPSKTENNPNVDD